MQMRNMAMIVPSWRDFPGRLVRLACAALLISTAMAVPRVNLAEQVIPVEPAVAAPVVQTP
jgi:hypothetical protein